MERHSAAGAHTRWYGEGGCGRCNAGTRQNLNLDAAPCSGGVLLHHTAADGVLLLL